MNHTDFPCPFPQTGYPQMRITCFLSETKIEDMCITLWTNVDNQQKR